VATDVPDNSSRLDTAAVPKPTEISRDGMDKRSRSSVAAVEAMLIPDVDAARLAGLSRASWHRLRAAGKLPPAVKLGRAVRWRRAEVVSWIEAGCPDSRTWAAIHAAAERRKRVS
jgi:predicted DNA-binding transcriptional regulator AlpA